MSIKIEDCKVLVSGTGLNTLYEMEYKNICITLNPYGFHLYWAVTQWDDFSDYISIDDYTIYNEDELFQLNLSLSFPETDLYTIIDIQKLLYSLRGNNAY